MPPTLECGSSLPLRCRQLAGAVCVRSSPASNLRKRETKGGLEARVFGWAKQAGEERP